MEPWQIALAVTFVVGMAVLIGGYLHDRRRLRRHAEQLASAPRRHVPGLPTDARPPRYVSAAAARTAPEPRANPSVDVSQATKVTAPLAGPGFAPDGTTAVLEHPAVVVIASDVTRFRQVLTPMERAAKSSTPLVLVAAGFTPEVVATLEVNAIQGLVRVLAVQADEPARTQICELTGASPVIGSDLWSGYLPDSSVGRCAAWSATASESRVVLAQA